MAGLTGLLGMLDLWDGEVLYEMIQDAKDSGDDLMEVAAMLEELLYTMMPQKVWAHKASFLMLF
jgi:hypothetical protein